MSKCISKEELGVTLQALRDVYSVYKATWEDMQQEEGWSDKERVKVLNQVVVLEGLVEEYEDLYRTY